MSCLSTRILKPLCLIVALVLTVVFQPSAFAQTVDIRVDGDNGLAVPNPPDPGDTWINAYKFLPDALVRAEFLLDNDLADDVRLWVAATEMDNPYWPDRNAANADGTGDRNATFLLDFNNVQLLGGFEGTETLPEERNPADNLTVLSGEITFPLEDECGPGNGPCFEPNNTPGCEDAACCDLVCNMDPFCCIGPWSQSCADLAKDNCTGDELPYGAYHVVTAVDVDETVRIDGFTITLGSAAGAGANSRGGGMLIDDASLAVTRCVFTGNAAGGGRLRRGRRNAHLWEFRRHHRQLHV